MLKTYKIIGYYNVVDDNLILFLLTSKSLKFTILQMEHRNNHTGDEDARFKVVAREMHTGLCTYPALYVKYFTVILCGPISQSS